MIAFAEDPSDTLVYPIEYVFEPDPIVLKEEQTEKPLREYPLIPPRLTRTHSHHAASQRLRRVNLRPHRRRFSWGMVARHLRMIRN